jgi:hypothetical protein
MGADVTGRYFTAVLLDTEGDERGASVVLEAQRCQRYGSSSWSTALCLLRVSGTSSVRYWVGLTTSAFTVARSSSASYTQPFGSDGRVNSEPFCDDAGDFSAVIVGRRNRSGIFVVFEDIEDASCQRCGLHTIEVKPRHAVGRNGSLHWDSRLGRGEVE